MRKIFLLFIIIGSVGLNPVNGQVGAIIKSITKKSVKSVVKSTSKAGARSLGKKGVKSAVKSIGKGVYHSSDDILESSVKSAGKTVIKSTDNIFKGGTSSVRTISKNSNLRSVDDIFGKKVITKNLIKKSYLQWAEVNGFKLKPNKRGFSILGKGGENLGYVISKGDNTIVQTYSLSARKVVNPLLDAKCISNATYKIDNTIFKIDKYGRTVEAKASSFSKQVVNRNEIKGAKENLKAMSKDGIKEIDHGGHLIAHSLGGNSGSLNIVAMKGSLNKGRFFSIELFINKNSAIVKNYKVKALYANIKTQRPSSFVQSFEYKGTVSNIQRLAKRHESFKYITKIDQVGKEYFECTVKHLN